MKAAAHINHERQMRFSSLMSTHRTGSMDTPQGCVTSPILTDACQALDTHILEAIGCTATVGFLPSHQASDLFQEEMTAFAPWCVDKFLDLNFKETKDGN